LKRSFATLRPLWIAIAANLVWMNLFTLVRYFLFVRPMMREAFPGLPDVVPMSLPIFVAWGLWALIPILTVSVIAFLMLQRGRAGPVMAIFAGSLAWLLVYGSLWIAVYLMALAPLRLIGIVLPLTWMEMAVAAFIVRWAIRRTPGPVRPDTSP